MSDEIRIITSMAPKFFALEIAKRYSGETGQATAVDSAGGAEVAYTGLMMGHRTCWIDTTATLGFMVELVTKNPVADGVFGAFRAAAENWDGKDPVRTFG